MKLCLIAPAPPPYGGIANWTDIVCKQIEKHKNDIKLSFVNIAPSVSYVDRKSGLKYILMSSYDLLRQRGQLIGQVKLDKPDVIHLTTSGRLSFVRDLLLLDVAKKFNIPCIYHLHFGRVPEIIKRKSIEYKLFKKAIKKVYKVLSIDPNTFTCIQTEFPEIKSEYIPNPIVASNCLSIKKQKEILFVGWVIKEKGIEELITAWNNACEQFPDYSLNLIGPYNQDYCKYLYNNYDMERVIMEGELSHDQTLKRIQECTILVLPSYSEGFPNVILEAMMAKKAIIATRVGAIPEMLSGDSGVLIEPKSAEQVEKAMRTLLLDQSYQEKLSTNAYQRVMNLYEANIVFKQYLEMWRL